MKTKQGEFVYIRYSRRKPYLPIAVADSIDEMAVMMKTTHNSIASAITHNKSDNVKGGYMKVRIDDASN